MAPLVTAVSTRALRVPGDKSISHRALICAALASGRSCIRGILASADVRSSAVVLRSLGVEVPQLGLDVRFAGRGLGGLTEAAGPLDCGNSGTTARLMAGVLAGHPFASRLVGDESLSRRPMGRIAKPLTAMGAAVRFESGEHLPMTIRGGELRPTTWTSPTSSAQVKSAVLLAGLVARTRVAVREPARSRDHTERMLNALGVSVHSSGTEVVLEPVDGLPAFQIDVPADPSSGAFFAALAAAGGLAGGSAIALTDIALNPTRLGFFRALRSMGASVTIDVEREECGEPVGTVRVRPSDLRGIRVAGEQIAQMIDELPMLACLATRADGLTEIRGAAELRVKESDRIAAVVANLRTVGGEAEELSDGLIVAGTTRPLRGAVRSHGDHRVAMAFAVLGALGANAISVDDRECVAISYPDFWSDLRRVTSG